MTIINQFKNFIQRGNVIDLAVGVIIGASFGKIVTSLVDDILMPPLGMLLNGVNFQDIRFTLKHAILDGAGKVVSPAVTLNIGNFIQVLVQFLIVAFSIFMIVRLLHRMKEKEVENAPPPTISTEEKLLTEIRDLLKK